MKALRDTLEQIADLLSAARQMVEALMLTTSSPARLAGLHLITLYLVSASSAVRGALGIVARL